MDRLNQQFGRPKSTRAPLGRTVTLGGVGKNTQENNQSVMVPTSVNGDSFTFTAAVVDGSDLPALLSMKTLRDNRAVLDLEMIGSLCHSRDKPLRLYISLGRRSFNLKEHPEDSSCFHVHWILPHECRKQAGRPRGR